MSIASPTFSRRDGFTIVELLIVIVVVAILAAITIVAYNGIQSRATFTRQVAEVDRVGKAVQLWSAANGKAFGQSGYGYNGNGLGGFNSVGGAYGATSMEDVLRQEGFLTGALTVNINYMLTPCTTNTDTRWVVLAVLAPAPPTSVAEQKAASGCTSSFIDLYTGTGYNRNFIKAY